MDAIAERIEALGGASFVRDFQPGWEAQMQAEGFHLRDRRIPVFPTVRVTPPSAAWLAATHLPALTTALFKALAHVLQQPAPRARLLDALQNRQELQLLDVGRLPRLADLFGRYDTFLRREGDAVVPTVIEANFNNVEGLLLHHASGRGGARLLAALGLDDGYGFPSALWQLWGWMLDRYARTVPGGPRPTVAIVWEPGHLVKDVELPHAAEWFRRWGHDRGIRVLAGDWRRLDHTPATGWTFGGTRVHLIWKNVGPFYPADLLPSAYGRLVAAEPDEVLVVSDVVGRLLGGKSLFAALWAPDTRRLFDAREWAAIRRLVPWTVEVRDGLVEGADGHPLPDLLRWLSQHREDMVIKPVLGSHGDGVLVGVDTPQDVWDAALGRAGEGQWIAMRFVPPEELTLPLVNPSEGWQSRWQRLYADCNFYVFGGRSGAVIRRASLDRVVNVARATPDGGQAGGVLIAATAAPSPP